MINKSLFILLIVPLYLLLLRGEPAYVEAKTSSRLDKPQAQIEAKKMDAKAEILAKYLARFNSPLQYHAQDFIDAAHFYDVDWKLVAAISGVESTFGKKIPGGYNGWGWGVYGTQAIYFKSWREGIFTVTKGLRENYINRGLLEPFAMNRIYATSPAWGSKVTFFMLDLEKFALMYKQAKQDNTSISTPVKIAVKSGELAQQ